jgi:S-adenosylmethionine hydrolase
MSRPRPTIVFLSDYGTADEFVGTCHAVIARRAPEVRVIDLTHAVPPHDVRAGALTLADALPYLPDGVLLAVVDPGVGGVRRGVALRTAGGRSLVGPDNGLLWPAAEVDGGVAAAVDLADSPARLPTVAATFHGRDVFAPVAAELARDTPLERVGTPLDPASLTVLEVPRPRREAGALVAHVLAIDVFGNLQLDAAAADLDAAAPGRSLTVTAAGEAHRAVYGHAFGDVAPDALVLYEDARRRLALAVNRGSAARRLRVGVDAELRIADR